MNAIGIVSCLACAALVLCFGLVTHRLTARRSGWDRLGRRYPAGRPRAAGVRFRRQTVRLNSRTYLDHLDVGLSGAGLRIGVPPLFRCFHRTLLIPWDDLTPDPRTPDPLMPQDRADAGDLALRIGESGTVTLTGPAATAAGRVLGRRAAAAGPGRTAGDHRR